MPLKIKRSRYLLIDDAGDELPANFGRGHPVLELSFADGRVARVDREQKLLARDVPVVTLGPGFAGETVRLRKRDPRSLPWLVEGATADPDVVRVVLAFCEAVRDKTFKPS